MPAVMTDEEAAKLEKRQRPRQTRALDEPSMATARRRRRAATDRSAPAGNVGGYNNFWLDRGGCLQHRRRPDAGRRSSIDPPDGRVPALTPDGAAAAGRSRDAVPADVGRAESAAIPASSAAGAYDDPERRPLGERCLLGFGSTSGPPVLPNYFYNNLHQIVQTPTTS